MGCAPSKRVLIDPTSAKTQGAEGPTHSRTEPTCAAAAATAAVLDSAEGAPPSSIMVLWRNVEVPLPADEQQRWDQLSSYNILNTEPEEAYDNITQLCKTLFKVPIAMVTFVDKDRVWLKSVQGLPGLKQVERRVSLCAWTLLSRFPEALVVPDLREDVRFKDFPVVVGWPHVRFYAACPLVNTSHTRLGTLCILDFQPREFSAESTSLLAQLAAMVMREVERKRAMNTALCSAAVRHASGDSIVHDRQGVMLLDMAPPKWAIHLVNDAWQRVTGISQEMASGSRFWDLFEPGAPAQVQAYQLAVEQRRNFELRVPLHTGLHTKLQNRPLNCAAAPSTRLLLQPAHQPASGGCCVGSEGDAESSSSLCPGEASQRRSLGGLGYLRFQFRSVSSVASHMAPAVSIPPALLTRDTAHNYYWSTVDIPTFEDDCGPGCCVQHDPTQDAAVVGDSSLLSASSLLSVGGSAAVSSGQARGPSSDGSGATQLARTTFSLLPEDNPFQDITIGSLLGWGSFGRVHRGYWNGSLVAVKVLEQVAGDCNPRSSLEPLLHHRLSHPNIVAMFDVCTQEVDMCEDGRPLQEVWMVLEFCNRGTLADAIQRGWLLSVQDGAPQPGQVNVLRALRTAREVAAAMEYLHSQNVLHGDLNGNNILLAGVPLSVEQDQRGFTAKVADFGLSRIITPENEKIITRTHGTITHMAPEVITEATHSKAADVYSFGVVLFELLSGIKPYHGMHYAQIVSSITSGKLLQLLPQQAGHLPTQLQQLLTACLATRANERPSFHEVHLILQQLEQHEQSACSAAAHCDPACQPQQQIAGCIVQMQQA